MFTSIDGFYYSSNSGGNGILFSKANFFSASNFINSVSHSSRTLLFLPCVDSKSHHSYRGKEKTKEFIRNRNHMIVFTEIRSNEDYTYNRLLCFQFVFLFNTLNTATGCIAPIFQCTSSLFHTNDFTARQSTHFQLAIEIAYRNRYQIIIANIGYWTWWQWCLRKIHNNFIKFCFNRFLAKIWVSSGFKCSMSFSVSIFQCMVFWLVFMFSSVFLSLHTTIFR